MSGEREIKNMPKAYSIQVRGVVQGVGFRPFVYRLAAAHNLKGGYSTRKMEWKFIWRGKRDHSKRFWRK